MHLSCTHTNSIRLHLTRTFPSPPLLGSWVLGAAGTHQAVWARGQQPVDKKVSQKSTASLASLDESEVYAMQVSLMTTVYVRRVWGGVGWRGEGGGN